MTNAKHIQQLLQSALADQSVGLYVSRVPENARDYDCSVLGCPNRAYAKGMCNAHYLRARKGKPLDAPLRHRTGGGCRVCGKPVNGKGGWGLCQSHYNIRRRAVVKSVCIQALGGKCSHCGGEFHHAAYDFHHLDASGKDANPSDMIGNRSIEAIAEEISKCILLCANCHRIEHAVE